MENILLANIGNRNIKYNWNFIEKTDKTFFEFTKYLYEEIENEKQNIHINILDSILNDYKIDKIYLFATNQKHHQDTYYEAKILQYLLKDKYEIVLIEKKDDPRNREEAFKFFEDFFNENKDLEEQNLIISWSWWVPAMKEALNFYSVINFKNCTILDIDEAMWDVFKSDIQNEYLKNFDKNILKEMIQSYDYSWAYTFLKNSRIKDIELENYVLYLSNRYNFNFEKANIILKNFKSEIAKNIYDKPKELENKVKYFENMIIELFDNVEITFEKWEYTMILWKTFSLQENIIRYLFEKSYKINTENDFDVLEKLWFEIKQSKKFEKYIEIYKLEEKLNQDYSNWNIEFQEFKKFNDKVLKPLKEVRNNSIVAHWFWWIERVIIENIVNDIKKFKQDFFWIKTNIFYELNKEILKLIK